MKEAYKEQTHIRLFGSLLGYIHYQQPAPNSAGLTTSITFRDRTETFLSPV